MLARANDLLFVGAGYLGPHGEAGDKATLVVVMLGVPVAGDLAGIVLVGHGIEDRLLGQPRRKGFPPRRLDQRQFFGSHGAVQRDGIHPTLPSRLIATSFWASTANSIGSCCSTSRTKPLTSRATASSWLSPRCMA